MYQMYFLIILPLIILFMITTRVWVEVSMYQKLEMIMENELYSTMVVSCGTKLYF